MTDSEIPGVKEYAQAQVYAEMYRFAWSLFHDVKEQQKLLIKKDLIQTINNLDEPEDTRIFMTSTLEDAYLNKPKYTNYSSMLYRNNPN
ncbi:hypothetical protein H6G93_26850 [Nostoc sp. FACHB-973]|nr:hypothetical protein [Nostoc sp. FACHB-973]